MNDGVGQVFRHALCTGVRVLLTACIDRGTHSRLLRADWSRAAAGTSRVRRLLKHLPVTSAGDARMTTAGKRLQFRLGPFMEIRPRSRRCNY
jgi:hypothetical protein